MSAPSSAPKPSARIPWACCLAPRNLPYLILCLLAIVSVFSRLYLALR